MLDEHQQRVFTLQLFKKKRGPHFTRNGHHGKFSGTYVQLVKSRHQYFVVNIAIVELGLVPNESPGNFTYYYRGSKN